MQAITIKTIIGLLATIIAGFGAAQAQNCTATEGRSAWRIEREVAGNRDFRDTILQTGWTFQLARAPHGWDVRILDEAGLDLSQMTPPLRGAPNPRQIYGWHFRNADNTGTNKGDVNALQKLRLFGFDPALTGTGGYKPSSAGGVDPQGQPGRGALTILDMGLADLEPGEKARMNYLKFNVCMSWPTTAREKQVAADEAAALEASREVLPEHLELMGSCGLDLMKYDITPYVAPVELSGDFDGDDAGDMVMPVTRKSDKKRGLAFCRAGTWTTLIGFDGKLGKHLSPGYFESVDWWAFHEKGPVGQGSGEGPPPTLVGDAIVVGKEGASSALIYWTGDGYSSYWQGD
ncbi:MAG: hypothetical protein DHS20C05_18050 [Hyphococcus sp.]|nr:MAG: hypothetical protein DHS20C05_18050 [Marinicaulis sp.]